MENFLTKFGNHSEYANYANSDMVKPNVSLCVLEDEVHYSPAGVRMYWYTKKSQQGNDVRSVGSKSSGDTHTHVIYIPDTDIEKFKTTNEATIEPCGIMVPGKYNNEELIFQHVSDTSEYPEFLLGFFVVEIPIDNHAPDPTKDNIYVILRNSLQPNTKSGSEYTIFPVKAISKYRKIIEI